MRGPLDIPYPADYVEGARNGVFTCLAVQPGERCVLVTDVRDREIAAALAEQFLLAGARLTPFVLENLATRPLSGLPAPIAAALELADVSCFAASAEQGELAMRMPMTDIINRRRIRHAHMVNITPRIMREGMRADFVQVDALSRWVLERLKPAREVSVRSAAGTDLRATFDSAIRWIKTSGIITREKWNNLPGGEVFTAPMRVDGVFVCDGVLGDWLAPKYGDMRDHPLAVTIEDSRIVDIECPRRDIADDFRAYTGAHANSNRVGEFALGTNIALSDVIGQILQDEKIPGVHIAFGHPYAEHTGADWTAPTHIDIVGRRADVAIDGEPIMEASRYLLDLASLPRGERGASVDADPSSARR
jgi:leucyl aminopeptidase (aminopeptidase T)